MTAGSNHIDINRLNKHLGNPVKLGIMAALSVNERLGFTELKEILSASDGNLASHLYSLEELGYVEISKQFLGRKPSTSVSATENGRQAFSEHLSALEDLLKHRT